MTNDEDILKTRAAYVEIANEIVSDDAIYFMTGCSNKDASDIICENMGWESFDLISDEFDFEGIYKEGTEKQIIAHMYLAFLRNQMFVRAIQRQIGPKDIRIWGCVFHEYWQKRLTDRLTSVQKGESETFHKWIH